MRRTCLHASCSATCRPYQLWAPSSQRCPPPRNVRISKAFQSFFGSYLFKALTPPFFAGAARIILQTALGGALVALPLAAFQYYGYRQFCTAGALSEAPAWCADPLPYLYGHVQRQYWGVGFLRYFRLQQVRRTLRSGRRWALDCTDVSLACA